MSMIPPSTGAAIATAVDALLNWKNKQSDSQNPQLLPQDDVIYLNLTLKKIPQKGRTNPNKIPLPHPIISPSFSELCLIIDDRPNSNLTSQIAKKKIKADGISVTKVIKLSKLKTDYKPFEAKRKLCDSYDMFFADKRVIPLLPKLLGKQFFRKKKLPLPVDLTHNNWKEQIERGCCSGLLFFRTGTCSVIRVAKVSMERDEIVENVMAAIDGAIGFVPKKLSGVRSLYLKFSDSVALPLYQSVPDIKLKIDGGVRAQDSESVEEQGKKKQSKKGRIHEMDHDASEDEEGEIENSNADGDGGSHKKKRSKKGKVYEIENDESEDEEGGIENGNADDGGSDKKKRKGDGLEVGKKKRSKRGKGQEVGELDAADEVLKEAKSAKKSVKEKKRKGDMIEESDVNKKPSDKIVKKKGKKQNGDSGKKEKKNVRSVSRV